jgi:hypothetical protein
VAAVKGFFYCLNEMAKQEPHCSFRHPVHGVNTLEEYLKTQALTDELEHIYNAANANPVNHSLSAKTFAEASWIQ